MPNPNLKWGLTQMEGFIHDKARNFMNLDPKEGSDLKLQLQIQLILINSFITKPKALNFIQRDLARNEANFMN